MRRVPSPSLQQYPIDILALRAPVVLLPLPGASIISVTGIGESSSIKGPISDDKDLEMNGPRHSNGSLSSPSCPTARFSAIPPTKQSCLELLITPMMDIGRRIWDTNNYGQAFSSDTLLYFLIFIRFNYTFEFDPIKVNERGNCRCCTDRIRFGIFATIFAGRKGEGERKKSIFFLISMQNTRDPS